MLGGIENYLYHVGTTLKKMGHRVIILCEKHDVELPDYEDYCDIKIIRHPYYNIPKRLLFAKPKIVSGKLRSFISEHVNDTDLIISRYPHYCFATTGLDLKIPVFYIPPSVHWKQLNRASSNLSVKAKFFNLVWKNSLDEMERKSILRSHKTILLSNNNAESLKKYYRLKEREFHVIPPGVDSSRFSGEKDLALMEELNIDKGTIILLYVGRLPPEKNVARLLRELRLLKRNNLRLLIVGDGSERRRLESMSNSLGLRDMVSFLGMRDDVERFYSIAHIFISPSKYEPFGQVILEAMAAGLQESSARIRSSCRGDYKRWSYRLLRKSPRWI
jgi:glycosyltransferase involved in cell wall biosynthesis